jgi:hypothetical protein
MRESDWKMVREWKEAHRNQMAALPFEEKLKHLERLYARARVLGGGRETVHTPKSGVVTHFTDAATSNTISTIRFFGVSTPLASAMKLQPGRGR